MGSRADPTEASGWVVLASFGSRRTAEHVLASLGRAFRAKARRGTVDAFVISGNRDGSLHVTESRVLSGAAVTAALMRVGLAVAVGFLGLGSLLRGAGASGHAAHAHQAHAEPDARAEAILSSAGVHAALALVTCEDLETEEQVSNRASERAAAVWRGSAAELVAALDPGPAHDWVRSAVGIQHR